MSKWRCPAEPSPSGAGAFNATAREFLSQLPVRMTVVPFLNDFAHEYYLYVDSRKHALQKPQRTDIQAIKKLAPEPEKKTPVTKPPVRTAPAQPVKPSYTQQPSYTRCLSKKANNGTTVLLQAFGSSETL